MASRTCSKSTARSKQNLRPLFKTTTEVVFRRKLRRRYSLLLCLLAFSRSEIDCCCRSNAVVVNSFMMVQNKSVSFTNTLTSCLCTPMWNVFDTQAINHAFTFDVCRATAPYCWCNATSSVFRRFVAMNYHFYIYDAHLDESCPGLNAVQGLLQSHIVLRDVLSLELRHQHLNDHER
jgi:hypothetical protein